MKRWLPVLLVFAVLLLLPDVAAWAQEATDALAPVEEEAGPVVPRGRFLGRLIILMAVAPLVILAALLRLLLRQAATSLIYLGGFALIFTGERLWPDGVLHWPMTGLGLIALITTVVLRVREMSRSREHGRKVAQRDALIWSLIGMASLVPYLLTLDATVSALGLDEDAEATWTGAMTALIPVVWIVGTLPMILLDSLMTAHPLALPPKSPTHARNVGLATALALALVFPVNHLATQHEWEYDAAYFKTTDAGTATLALVRSLSEPVTAYLFFPAGSDVRQEVEPYFDTLAEASGGMLIVEIVDQALVPQLAEELKVRDNGYVALVRGEASEKFTIGTDLDRARSRLKKLDETVQEHLLSIAKGERVAYLLTGHGEASPRERDEPLRKLNLWKQLVESQNYSVENFGVTEGSTDAVPEDADVVVVAAPTKPLLPEEEAVLKDYLDRGGKMIVMTDPGADPLEGLLGHLGVRAGSGALAHATAYIRQTRGISDRVLLVSNRFGSHEAVTTLSRNSTQLALVTPTVTPLEKVEGATAKVSTLVRSMPETWLDANGDRQRGADEPAEVWDLVVAVEGEGEEGYRAIVLGDVSAFSDPVLQYSQGNAVFAVDALRWLAGEASLLGETESEEDVRIQHTRDEDVAWFWGTIVGFPVLVLVTGLVFVNVRRRR